MPRFAANSWPEATPAPAMPASSPDTSAMARRLTRRYLEFAEAYADQTQKDWQALLKSKHWGETGAGQVLNLTNTRIGLGLPRVNRTFSAPHA